MFWIIDRYITLFFGLIFATLGVLRAIQENDVKRTLNFHYWKSIPSIREDIASYFGVSPWRISYTTIGWHLRSLGKQQLIEMGISEVKTGKHEGKEETVYRLSKDGGEQEKIPDRQAPLAKELTQTI